MNALGGGFECGKERGEFVSEVRPALLGEWSAYISESCDNSAGQVRAENILRMLVITLCMRCLQAGMWGNTQHAKELIW